VAVRPAPRTLGRTFVASPGTRWPQGSDGAPEGPHLQGRRPADGVFRDAVRGWPSVRQVGKNARLGCGRKDSCLTGPEKAIPEVLPPSVARAAMDLLSDYADRTKQAAGLGRVLESRAACRVAPRRVGKRRSSCIGGERPRGWCHGYGPQGKPSCEAGPRRSSRRWRREGGAARGPAPREAGRGATPIARSLGSP